MRKSHCRDKRLSPQVPLQGRHERLAAADKFRATEFRRFAGLSPRDMLERFPAKWIPVRVKKTRQIKN
jgi:hypothetical protein